MAEKKKKVIRNKKGQFAPGGHPANGFDKTRIAGEPIWNKETSITYNYNKFGRMPIKKVQKYVDNPPDDATPFQLAAARAVLDIYSAQVVDERVKVAKEVTDRTEGRAQQRVEISHNEFEGLSDDELVALLKEETK